LTFSIVDPFPAYQKLFWLIIILTNHQYPTFLGESSRPDQFLEKDGRMGSVLVFRRRGSRRSWMLFGDTAG
jgi:hypothetical protein